MILKIDHIALSSDNFKRDIELFNKWGYITQFTQTGTPNLSIKKELLHTFNEKHDLSLLTKHGNFGIELLNHHNICPQKGNIKPIFENLAKEDIQEGILKPVFNQLQSVTLKSNGLSVLTSLTNSNSSQEFLFNSIAIEVSNIEDSIEFWKPLGFSPIEISESNAKLEFKSIFSNNPLYLIIQKTYEISSNHLDNKGFNCIAFICKSIDRVLKKYDSSKLLITKKESLIVNNQNLNICFLKGYNNEIIELIEIEN